MFKRKKYEWKDFFQNIHKGDKVRIISNNEFLNGKIGRVTKVFDEFNIYVRFKCTEWEYVFREKDLRVIL